MPTRQWQLRHPVRVAWRIAEVARTGRRYSRAVVYRSTRCPAGALAGRERNWNGSTGMVRGIRGALACLVVAALIGGCRDAAETPPPEWQDLVATKGQHYPVPRAWLASDEARIAHDLVLPAAVPRPVPFDFEAARGPWYWPRSKREVAVDYFRHLCRTEAGEWIFETPENVEGLYFARPRGGGETERYVNNIYGVEAPWVERYLMVFTDSLNDAAGLFVAPPFRNYIYIEQPKREVEWQREIKLPFIKLSGYKTRYKFEPVGRIKDLVVVSPMQLHGVNNISSKFGYTWRGIVRAKDREFRISGTELVIYKISDRSVIAVKRNFLLGKVAAEFGESAQWSLANSCKEIGLAKGDMYISNFAQKVLIEPSL